MWPGVCVDRHFPLTSCGEVSSRDNSSSQARFERVLTLTWDNCSRLLAAFPPKSHKTSFMADSDTVQVEGKIVAVLPGTMFRVELENGHQVLAHISGKLRKHFIKITVGDTVKMEMANTTGMDESEKKKEEGMKRKDREYKEHFVEKLEEGAVRFCYFRRKVL